MRVLIVSGAGPPAMDGVGDYTARLVPALRRARPDWDWTWMARRPGLLRSPLGTWEGARYLRPVHAWMPPWTALACAAVRVLRPDLLHVQEQIHSFYETDAAVRLAAAARCPVITTLHEFHEELPSIRHTVALIARSRAIIANDRRNADRCLAHTGRQADMLGWSGSTVRAVDDTGRLRTPGTLVTFGFLSRLKNLDTAFTAFRLLKARHAALRWLIVGPLDPTSAEQADLQRRLAHPDVVFTGALDLHDGSLARVLAGAHVGLLPYADGASMRRTTLHAMWESGVPVVTTRPPADEPAIVDGENCLLTAPDDAEAMARAVGRVLDDAGLEARLREGSRRAAREHGWDRLARLHLDLYHRVLA